MLLQKVLLFWSIKFLRIYYSKPFPQVPDRRVDFVALFIKYIIVLYREQHLFVSSKLDLKYQMFLIFLKRPRCILTCRELRITSVSPFPTFLIKI